MTKKSLIALTLLCAGCRADMVIEPGRRTASAYAPVNESERPGVIKYLNAGAQSVKEARREDAYMKMNSACGGPYKIVREGNRSEGGAIIPVGGMAIYDENQYVYIEFECVAGKN